MFYYPNREQAIRIQDTLKTLYQGVGGEYYSRDEAWDYVRQRTQIDLKAILVSIAEKNKKVAQENALLTDESVKEVEEKIKQMSEGGENE